MAGVLRLLILSLFALQMMPVGAYPVFNIGSNTDAAVESLKAAQSLVQTMQSLTKTLALAEEGELAEAEKTLEAVEAEITNANAVIAQMLENHDSFGDVDLSRLREPEFRYLQNFLRRQGIEITDASSRDLVVAYSRASGALERMVRNALRRDDFSESGNAIDYDSFSIATGPVIGDLIGVGGCITKLLK
ncbi:hypothetical protein [Roseibium sediminicola]|uniref:Uncharacterized protein n=1 Tax=Roseibium sediminicola TaxID=2933272 RepID=A0ABT0GY73_9HYPH|nr:hypothetical protein [Roseibium sp. CAU 1639]MCK7614394.1 hypothetical protein [Roseibium sp. CAU 1639]